MRQPLVAGNWKMNGTRASAEQLMDEVIEGLNQDVVAEVAVCPPYVLLGDVEEKVKATPIKLGAQDVSEQSPGAYTGEIAAEMLKDFGCQYVIVGHSERRAYQQESDELVAKKLVVAQQAGLTPILCVGETLEEREADQTEAVVARQLEAVFQVEGGAAAMADTVIAYEPVWAIGTGKTATPDQAQDVHRFIRERVAKKNEELAARIRILYGGSVKGSNAEELMAMADIDGGLIGGASLKAEEFLAICRAAR